MPPNTVVIELIEQNMMINSVKSFRKVEENCSSRHFFIKFRKSWKNGNGPIIFNFSGSPVLKLGRTFAILRVSGKQPLTKDRLIISVKGSTIMSILSLMILIGMLSTPESL